MALTEPGSAVAEIMEKTGLPWADVRSPTHITEVLTQLVNAWEQGSHFLPAGHRTMIEQFKLQRVNETLDSVLHQAAGGLRRCQPERSGAPKGAWSRNDISRPCHEAEQSAYVRHSTDGMNTSSGTGRCVSCSEHGC